MRNLLIKIPTPLYRPTALEWLVVISEIVVLGLFAWSFTGDLPLVFRNMIRDLGIADGGPVMIVFSLGGMLLSIVSLYPASRQTQQNIYRLASGPIIFYAFTVGLYQTFFFIRDVQRFGSAQAPSPAIIVHLLVAGLLWTLSEATFRDPKPRREWKRQG